MKAFDALKILVDVLIAKGYGNSVNNQLSVDGNGDPLPWFSYPAIDYLRGLDLTTKHLFEYGAGCSTLFWASMCKDVVSVENDRAWHAKVSSAAPPNAKVLLREDEASYFDAILEDSARYDVIVVDGGLNRRKMAERSLHRLAPGGFIILDNSDCHVRAAAVLRQADLIQVDMNGFSPINTHETTTSFFFARDFNFKPKGEWQPLKTPWCMKHYVDE
ncbi:MAG: class I SAM-dependent methyltransferase [Verrucomicrobia bacterium]|nr:class I SAM-dependent methyltransferase [Verrucomicrobiota bacterium]